MIVHISKKFLLLGCIASSMLVGMEKKVWGKNFVAEILPPGKQFPEGPTVYSIIIRDKITDQERRHIFSKTLIEKIYWDKNKENVLHIIKNDDKHVTTDMNQKENNRRPKNDF